MFNQMDLIYTLTVTSAKHSFIKVLEAKCELNGNKYKVSHLLKEGSSVMHSSQSWEKTLLQGHINEQKKLEAG